MKEQILDLVDGMRCAQQKIRECKVQRERLVVQIAELEAAIAYQGKSAKEYEQRLDAVLAG